MTCEERERLGDERLNHRPEYRDAYHELDDDELESLTLEQERAYMVDPDAEDAWQDAMRTKQAEHFVSCTAPECVKTARLWREHDDLSGFIRAAESGTNKDMEDELRAIYDDLCHDILDSYSQACYLSFTEKKPYTIYYNGQEKRVFASHEAHRDADRHVTGLGEVDMSDVDPQDITVACDIYKTVKNGILNTTTGETLTRGDFFDSCDYEPDIDYGHTMQRRLEDALGLSPWSGNR